ncbi:MAG: Lrp/AsnC family transcriptional regulator [Chloroflexi bacterium]|nr:Lrp/AsnC family transcriptional regulator [Chloroflexota bacterium]
MLKEILKILEDDARAAPERIAKMVNLPPDEVARLISEAEADRTILKYKTIIDWAKAGNDHVWALIEVKVTPEPEAGFDSVAERVARFPQVRSAYLASGTYDLLLIVLGKTEREIGDFVSQKLSHVASVQGTVTHFVLKRYKEDGEPLKGAEEVRRQAVVL